MAFWIQRSLMTNQLITSQNHMWLATHLLLASGFCFLLWTSWLYGVLLQVTLNLSYLEFVGPLEFTDFMSLVSGDLGSLFLQIFFQLCFFSSLETLTMHLNWSTSWCARSHRLCSLSSLFFFQFSDLIISTFLPPS